MPDTCLAKNYLSHQLLLKNVHLMCSNVLSIVDFRMRGDTKYIECAIAK